MRVPRLAPGAGAATVRSWPPRPRAAILPLVVILTAAGSTGARAAEWSVQPELRLSETWTDNVDLVAEDPDEEWITEVAPGIRLSGEGRRVRLDFGYRLQHLAHANDPDRDRTTHQVNGEGKVELVRERLFFDASVKRSLDTSGPDFSGLSNSLVGSEDRDSVTTWEAGPRLQYEAGRFARIDAQAQRQQVDYGSRARGHNTADSFAIDVSSGSLFPDWGWALGYSVREEEDTGDASLQEDRRFAQARAELNWRTSAATQLFAAGGAEENEFETADAGDPVDGEFWEVGARWHPSRTVSLEVAGGERFFGDTARASVNVIGRALSFRMNYAESLITSPQLQLEQVNALLVDDQGNPVLGPDGQPVTAVIGVPTVVDDVILQRRADMRLAWDYSHSRVALSLIATDREFQLLGQSEQSERADIEFQWTRLTRTTITAGVGYIEQGFAGFDRQDETTLVRLGTHRRLRGDTVLTGEIEHLSRDSTVPNAEYDNLRATVGLNMRF